MSVDLQTERVEDLVQVKISEEFHIAKARQAAQALAEKKGADGLDRCYIATSVSELAHNLFWHAKEGVITVRVIRQGNKVAIEVVSEDSGPGIQDLEQAQADGFSTNGGLGGGLAGVERLMDEFEITTVVGVGTRIIARKWTCQT